MSNERLTVVMPDGKTFGPADHATIIGWMREGRVPDAAMIRDDVTGQQRSSVDYRATAGGAPFQPPPPNDLVSVFIPRNNQALVAYYLGVFSLAACIPVLGIVGVGMAVAAVFYGRRGLRFAKQNPDARGGAHAWVGIIAGSICAVVGALMQLMSITGIVVALLDKR